MGILIKCTAEHLIGLHHQQPRNGLNGKALADIPAQVVGIDYCSINENTANLLGVEIPSELGYELNLIKD